MPSRNRVVVPARKVTQPGGIDSLESILWLLKSLKNRALAGRYDNSSTEPESLNFSGAQESTPRNLILSPSN